MAYMTQSGLMSDVRDALARASTGYTGQFEDANGNPSADWANFRANDATKQSAWQKALSDYQTAGSPDVNSYVNQNFAAQTQTAAPQAAPGQTPATTPNPVAPDQPNAPTQTAAPQPITPGVTPTPAAPQQSDNAASVQAAGVQQNGQPITPTAIPGQSMWNPGTAGTGGLDYNAWVNQVGQDGLTNNQRAARQAGYTGDFGQGGHVAFLGQDATKWNAYNSALQSSWQSANAPAPTGTTSGTQTTTTGTGTPATTGTQTPAATGGQGVDTMMGNLVNNPSLPPGTQIDPTLQAATAGEFQTTPTVNPNGQNAPAAQGTAATAAAVDPSAASHYDATLNGNNTPQMTAAQGQVTADMTVQGQLSKLMEQFNNGQTPAWAAPAMQRAMETLNARGLDFSSLAGQAVVQAAMQSALPIAAADATAYQQMAALNLNNEQQAQLTNTQNRVQAMFNDQAQSNTAKQINAASDNQVKQFYDSLLANVREFNTSQVNAMQQTNVSEANKQQQFNQSLADQRERFNVQNQVAIDQSNVAWRRTLNTNNTAAVNAANQTNAQNLLNLSNTALNNIWQQFRDNADYAFTASENAQSRASNMAIAAFQKDAQFQLLDQQQQNQFGQLIGATVMNILSGVL